MLGGTSHPPVGERAYGGPPWRGRRAPKCLPPQGRPESQNPEVPPQGPLPCMQALHWAITPGFCTAEGMVTRREPWVLPVAGPGSPCPACSLIPPSGGTHKWATSHPPPTTPYITVLWFQGSPSSLASQGVPSPLRILPPEHQASTIAPSTELQPRDPRSLTV